MCLKWGISVLTYQDASYSDVQTVFITSSGAWKLGGFGFAISADQASSGSTSPFHYPVSYCLLSNL